MKLHHIRDVVAVADHGSLRSASRHLNLAQSAITRSIRELEQELGAPLFERRTNGAVLTQVGEAFVRRAKGIQLDLQRARDEVDQIRGAAGGSVAVALSTAAQIALLPRVVEPFRRRFPDVNLHVVEAVFPTAEAGLQDGRYDFYIGPFSEKDTPVELLMEKLFDNRRIVVGRRGHPFRTASSLRDLAGAGWIASSVTSNAEEEFYPLFERFDLPKPRIVAQAGSALSNIALCASSDLLVILPQQWLDFVSSTDLIERIHVKEVLSAPPIYSARRARLPLTPAAEHLLDLFRRAALNHARRLDPAPSELTQRR